MGCILFRGCPWFRHFDRNTFRFVSAQHLESWPKFTHVLISTGSRLADCFVFCSTVITLDVPWFKSDFGFRSISWEGIDGIFTKCCICIDIGIVSRRFPQIYNSVRALDWSQNFVSAQYLENELMDFDNTLHLHWYWSWQDLGWDCYASISANS